MAIKDLTTADTLRLLTSYEDALRIVVTQSNAEEDAMLLQHIISNIEWLKRGLSQASPTKFSWKVMTAIAGLPQTLASTTTHALQYDTEQNINKNVESVYRSLLLNNASAKENLQMHINRNRNIEIISAILTVASLILGELIAPWSAWGISSLVPLFPILAIPLIIVAFLSISIEILAGYHSYTLRELYYKHEYLEMAENKMPDQNGLLGQQKSARFFKPSNPEDDRLLARVQQSFEETHAEFRI